MTALRVPLVRPDLGDAEADAVARVVRSGWVMQGPEVAAFERELADAVGAANAIAVANGTVALELSLRALGIGPGDEVITVSHSFIATANAIVAVGARPVFVDVEEPTFGMAAAGVKTAIGPRTRAILCVHQFGFPCDLDGILAAAGELPVIEDAACAIGSRIGHEPIGRPRGRLACFSFHPRKVITTGEGGMITTGDQALAQRLRLLRQHALAAPTDIRQRDPLGGERFLMPAFNARMTDMAAALGRSQLRRLEAIVAERRRLANRFILALVDHPVLSAPTEGPAIRANWQSFPTRVRPGAALSQQEVMRFLLDRGIASRGGIANAHEEPAYPAGTWSGGPLPMSEDLRRTTVLLPLFHGMTAAEEQAVVDGLQALRSAS